MNRPLALLLAGSIFAAMTLGILPARAQEIPGGIGGIAPPPPPPPPPPPVLPPPPPPSGWGIFNPASIMPQSTFNPITNPLDQNSFKNIIQGAGTGIVNSSSGLNVNSGQPSIKNSNLLGGSASSSTSTNSGKSVGGISGVGSTQGVDLNKLMNVDLETAMMAIQTNRSQLLETQLRTQLTDVQARNEQLKKLSDQMTDLNKKIVEALQRGDLATMRQLSTTVAQLKAQYDSLSNTQQMDMLKLQSLTNKRNEAFDLMTNFIKKMADARSSILGNMR